MPGIDETRALRSAEDRGADRVRHALARRRQVRRDAGRADREGRPCARRPRHRRRRRRGDPRAGAAWIADPAIDVVITTGGTGFTGRDVTPEAWSRCSKSAWTASRPLFHMVSYPQDRLVDDPVARHRRRRRRDLSSSACRARPAPAAMPGTRSWCTSSITATGRAISSRSCRGSTSTCGAPRRRARRSDSDLVAARQR